MFVKMYLNFVDMKHCINNNRYIIYSQRWHNLMKIYKTSLKVEMNAKN